jgi:hypothetical protein
MVKWSCVVSMLALSFLNVSTTKKNNNRNNLIESRDKAMTTESNQEEGKRKTTLTLKGFLI